MSKFAGVLQAAQRRDESEAIESPNEPKTGTQAVPKPKARKAEPKPLESATAATETAQRGRPANGKRSDPNFVQTTAYINKETHRDVKIALIREGQGREYSELIEELLSKWLKTQ